MPRPRGVAVILPGGERIECDEKLRQIGVDDKGLDQWRVELDTHVFRPGVDRLVCEVLPGLTSVGILASGALMPQEKMPSRRMKYGLWRKHG